MKEKINLIGVVAMAMLAALILALIYFLFAEAVGRMTPDGKVPLADAGLFTALLLSFREVLAVIKSIWDHVERSESTEAISNSQPLSNPNPPAREGR